MAYLRESNLTFTLGSSGGGAVGAGSGTASSHINGFIESIYIAVDGDFSTCANAEVLITSSSTSKVILRIIEPSSGGATYYPRQHAMASTLNAAIFESSQAIRIPMFKERIKATIASSSGTKYRGKTATIKAIWS